MTSILNEVLASTVDDKPAASSTAFAVRKDNYHQLVAFKNVTSYSIQQVFHRCPREFQLTKLEANCNGSRTKESNPTFAFGHAVGAGVATYDQTKNIRDAIWSAFLAWNIDLFEELPKPARGPDPKKSFHAAIWALYLYETFVAEETDLAEYEVICTEATVAVDFENGHFYVGHIDELLRHKTTGRYKTKENKTTSYASVDPALYSNSDQVLSYSLVIDSVGASEYDALYTIYSTTDQRWIPMEFTKTHLAKAEWLQDQLFTHSAIDLYAEHNYFPKRGGSCIRYNKRCPHYESCDFDSARVYGKRYDALPECKSFEELDAVEHYQYKFKYSDIVKTQKQRIQNAI